MLKQLFTNKIAISLLKWTVVLFLINLFIINPAIKGLDQSLRNLQDKAIIKIVSLDLISNPLTFVKLSALAIQNNNIDNAELYLNYAEILAARYSYPTSLKNSIAELRNKIQKIKAEH